MMSLRGLQIEHLDKNIGLILCNNENLECPIKEAVLVLQNK